MPASRQVTIARRIYPLAFRGALLCVILAIVAYVAGIPIATAFGVAGLVALIMGVVTAGIATSEPA